MGQWWEYVINLWLAQFYNLKFKERNGRFSATWVPENGKVAKGHRELEGYWKPTLSFPMFAKYLSYLEQPGH